MDYDKLWQRLTALYDAGEAKAIVRMVLDIRYGMSLADIYSGKVTQLSGKESEELEKIIERLEKAEPVQYVLGETSFCGRTFEVGPGVLIPRPETEDLCRMAVGEASGGKMRILDVGTGSGCIAITLAKEIPEAEVEAWDISDEALRIAENNNRRLDGGVRIVKCDALDAPEDIARWDMIVSNPPYVSLREKEAMERNVLEYEPEEALFVSDDDPLVFYRSIARYGIGALSAGGRLLFEINPLYHKEMEEMLTAMGYSEVKIADDRFGKKRFAVAKKDNSDNQNNIV